MVRMRTSIHDRWPRLIVWTKRLILLGCSYGLYRLIRKNWPKDLTPDKGPGNWGYKVAGKIVRSPYEVCIDAVRGYMGGVIQEVLADGKVNE